MVNARSGPDERDLEILAALRSAGAAVSGQILSERLGISRVALWKRIERLKGFAYRIEGGPRGYRLLEEDVVVPWAFPDHADVIYRSETTSTMDEAWRLAEAGAPSGTLVVAEHQTAGRGRQARPWSSPGGGLYLTLVLRPRLPASHAAGLALEGACALSEWLERTHACRLEFQWPGDLVAGTGKAGGLLVELAGAQEAPRFYLLGLGVYLHAAGLPDDACSSLADLTDPPPLRRSLAQAFRTHMAAWSERPLPRPRDWEARTRGLGRSVSLQDWRGRCFQGRFQGFDDRGCLVLVDPRTGTETAFQPGEVLKLLPGDPSQLPGAPT